MSSGPDPSKGLWSRPSTEMASSLRQHTGGPMVGKLLCQMEDKAAMSRQDQA
ncbi:hypothetical protein BC939DRAFT_504225 [Gamsiella multidivaricata]|uniref:uncharacterized protein n=1 Tax=Gamsiella multidivaricata TaxID=101098 RepID=UPI00221F7AA3|nr:uncharacterized protein BC939DRAFT_504225 [Gamsiella multidivaricata]KAI7821698.1 hypothetical protein BC939DRAFT_504225 [Gamsiella multidivaricata]